LKIVNWLLHFRSKKSHFFVVSQSENKTYVFVDGKVKRPANYFTGSLLTEEEQRQLNDIMKTYFKLIDK